MVKSIPHRMARIQRSVRPENRGIPSHPAPTSDENLAPPTLPVLPIESPPPRPETSTRIAEATDRPAPAPEPTDSASRPTSLPPARGPRSLLRGDRALPRVLLSFDGGSEADAAPSILNALEREGVRTTFFLTGNFIRQQPDLVLRILEAGHEVGNHTDHHRHLTTWEANRRHDTRPDVDRHTLRRELDAVRSGFWELTGTELVPLWRAPYGEVNEEILTWAAEAGYTHVGWSAGLDSLDWVSDPASRAYRSPDEFLGFVARRALEGPGVLNGAIILMHLHSARPSEARLDGRLAEIIRLLRATGYELVPATALLDDAVEGPRRASSGESGR